jgi:hypothetical protein
MPTIKLSVKGLGHVPSFKNSKMWTGRKLITKPERQVWMDRCTRSFESQLRSAYQTSYTGTQTVPSLHSWIASSIPRDDSVHWIPELRVSVAFVEPGEEGAEIVIEPIP